MGWVSLYSYPILIHRLRNLDIHMLFIGFRVSGIHMDIYFTIIIYYSTKSKIVPNPKKI